jgi:hypothetical protein
MTNKTQAPSAAPGRGLFRTARTGRIVTSNTVAAAKVAVAANKKARIATSMDVLDLAEAQPI